MPESPLPGVFSRFRDRFRRDGQPDNSGNGAGGHGEDEDDEDDDDALELPQITEEDLRARLECCKSKVLLVMACLPACLPA